MKKKKVRLCPLYRPYVHACTKLIPGQNGHRRTKNAFAGYKNGCERTRSGFKLWSPSDIRYHYPVKYVSHLTGYVNGHPADINYAHGNDPVVKVVTVAENTQIGASNVVTP